MTDGCWAHVKMPCRVEGACGFFDYVYMLEMCFSLRLASDNSNPDIVWKRFAPLKRINFEFIAFIL